MLGRLTAYEAADGRGRRAGLPRGAQRRRHQRRHRRQRHPGPLRGDRQLPLRARARPARRPSRHVRELFDGLRRDGHATRADGARPGPAPARRPRRSSRRSAVPASAQVGLDRRRAVLRARHPGGQLRPRRPQPGPHDDERVPGRSSRRRRGRAAALARPDRSPLARARDRRPAGDRRAENRPTSYHTGPVTLRRGQVPPTTTDQRLLDERGPTDWLHTDPWRVLRIQSEFVEGFGALAELGPAVSVFGSARTEPDDAVYAIGRGGRPRAGGGRLRGDHRRRSRRHGGGQQGGLRGRRAPRSAWASSCRSSRG